MEKFHDLALTRDPEMPWQERAIFASMGTTTGLMLMAMLAKEPKNGPALGQWCNIDKDGYVETQVRVDGVWQTPRRLGTVIAVRDSLRRLADHCKLSDQDREAMFEELRKWVRRDHRATSGEAA